MMDHRMWSSGDGINVNLCGGFYLAASSLDPVARRTLASLSMSVAKSKRIIVITGAGISCSCGIPDFRSTDGLYALVKEQYPDVILKGRDLFDASLFRDPTSTSIFYSFISQLKQSIDMASPSRTHHFIRTLDEKKKLLRSYTQNIDGLEEKAGLIGSTSKIRAKDVRNIQLHGDIHRVRCTLCSADLPCTGEYLQFFAAGLAPDCPECTSRARLARSARPLRIGTLRPGIVLYDEAHPLGDDIGAIQASDVSRKPDMLIIMGTSLKVHGLRKLVKAFAKAVHASTPPDPLSAKKSYLGKVIFVNKTPPGSEWNGVIDYHIEGETDAWAHKVEEDWRKVRPSDWEVQQTLDDDDNNAFKAMKDKPTASGTENIPPAPAVEPSTTLPKAPSSPTKRAPSTSHYTGGDCSPSKKQDLGNSKRATAKIPSHERGLLFADATNSCKKDVANRTDDSDLQIMKLETAGTDRVKRGPSKRRKKVDVVIPVVKQRELKADVFD
ncbi:DHS-like NAD/FAD-binding domain-containing protein [Russula earlei]|uniref:DHS-like NAD/FAD-binding domain-containing protein n=1 Tax=Russula earlei TaxID=71964 RepID=A0ACC0UN84_9AGAM|nr:DHS-like NAD/FAD-binding domain-containing protein [Russula earlei]